VRATRNLYQVLQIDPEAEPDVIEVVYRRLARKYHPDVSAVPDAAERMKEINAAYEVLHDPERRASYDRELAAREAPFYEEAPESDLVRWATETEPAADTDMIACLRHPGFGSVTSCTDCGGSLCAYCARLFQPPTCTNCLLRWAGRRRLRLALPAMALPGLFAVGYLAWTWLLRGVLGFEPSFWLLLVLAYWTGSIFFGVRGARELAPKSDTVVSGFIACFLGPFAAPVLIGRSLWEYRRIQRLEMIARTA
jgi:DnaJ-domain-containing protein 1